MRNAHNYSEITAELQADARATETDSLAEFHALMEDPDELAYWEAMQERRMEEFVGAIEAGEVDEMGDLL